MGCYNWPSLVQNRQKPASEENLALSPTPRQMPSGKQLRPLCEWQVWQAVSRGGYLLGLDGLRRGEDVRVVLPLKHTVQYLQLLLREQVSPHLLPEKISARQ